MGSAVCPVVMSTDKSGKMMKCEAFVMYPAHGVFLNFTLEP